MIVKIMNTNNSLYLETYLTGSIKILNRYQFDTKTHKYVLSNAWDSVLFTWVVSDSIKIKHACGTGILSVWESTKLCKQLKVNSNQQFYVDVCLHRDITSYF